MNELLESQINTLFIFAITGFIIGILFDFFRIQRKVFKTYDIITYIQDIIFWIASGIILTFVILKYTDGEIRIYMIFGIIIGIIVYFSFISKYMIKIFVNIIKFLLRILDFLLYPIKKINEIIKKSWKNKNNVL